MKNKKGYWFTKDTLKILGDTWKVEKYDSGEEVDRKTLDRSYLYGQISWEDGVMRLWNGNKTSRDEKPYPEYFKTFYMKTVLHEVLHILFRDCALDRILKKDEYAEIEEETIDNLAFNLVNFLVDNGLTKV